VQVYLVPAETHWSDGFRVGSIQSGHTQKSENIKDIFIFSYMIAPHGNSHRTLLQVQLAHTILFINYIYCLTFNLFLNCRSGKGTKQRVFTGKLLVADKKKSVVYVLALKSAVFFHVANDQVASLVDKCLVRCTHIPASVAKICSRSGFRVNQTVWRTLIWRGKIRCFLLKELDCFTSIE